MKLLTSIVYGIILTLTSITYSQAAVTPEPKFTDEFCESASELALVTMAARQKGVPPSVLIRDTSNLDLARTTIATLANDLVYLAYSLPLESTQVAKSVAIDDFTIKVYIACKESV